MPHYRVSHLPSSTTPLSPAHQIPTMTFETRKMADAYLTEQARIHYGRNGPFWNVLWSRIQADGEQGNLRLYVWARQWAGGPDGRLEGVWGVEEVEG